MFSDIEAGNESCAVSVRSFGSPDTENTAAFKPRINHSVILHSFDLVHLCHKQSLSGCRPLKVGPVGSPALCHRAGACSLMPPWGNGISIKPVTLESKLLETSENQITT